MRRLVLCVGFVVFCGMFAGCEQQPGQSGHAAVVIDLQRIVSEMGWAEQTRTQLEPLQQQFSQQLSLKQSVIDKELQEAFKAMGENPTDEQKKAFQELQNSRMASLEQEKQKAVQEFQQARVKIDQQFKEQLMPYARGAALQHGAKIVLIKNPQNVLINDPLVDITEQVIGAMRQNMSANKGLSGLPANTEKPVPGQPDN